MTELSTHVFELDLTSVCVSTGVVQLPMKMQPFFVDGAILAKLDGEAVPLEFSGPRRLGGFKSHFEKRALNANDRLRFELVVDDGAVADLTASCIKRERNKPVATRSAAYGESSGSAVPRSDEPGEPPKREASEAGESSAGAEPGAVRAIKRVTIKGSDSLPAIVEFPSLGRGAGDGRGRAATQATGHSNGATRWRPLDGVSPTDTTNVASDVEFCDNTVRAIRRRGSPAAASTAPAAPSVHDRPPGAASTPHHMPGDGAAGVRPRAADEARPLSLSELVAPDAVNPASVRSKRAVFARPRLLAGRSPRAERENGSNAVFATPAQAAGTPREDAISPPLIEERELVPVARATANATSLGAASTSAGGADSVMLNPDRAALDSDWSSGKQLTTWLAAVDYREARPAKVGGDADLGGALQGRATDSPQAASGDASGDAAADDVAATRVAVDAAQAESASADAEQFTGYSVRAATGSKSLGAAGDGALEDDVKRVDDYLRNPETPAIVRSDFVAERLGLHAERCERALERLSENRERVSRIRKGAYMIRRDATRQAEN